jgi:hypothetical protein
LLFRSARARRPTSDPFVDLRDSPSGCFSDEDRQHPLGVEILDAKR